jgi:hypothetical protein
MKISYIPSRDELILMICPFGGRPSKKAGPLKLWSDKKGKICAVSIANYSTQLEELRRNLNTVQIGGIWKGVRITSKDIKEVRKTLLGKIEEKW